MDGGVALDLAGDTDMGIRHWLCAELVADDRLQLLRRRAVAFHELADCRLLVLGHLSLPHGNKVGLA